MGIIYEHLAALQSFVFAYPWYTCSLINSPVFSLPLPCLFSLINANGIITAFTLLNWLFSFFCSVHCRHDHLADCTIGTNGRDLGHCSMFSFWATDDTTCDDLVIILDNWLTTNWLHSAQLCHLFYGMELIIHQCPMSDVACSCHALCGHEETIPTTVVTDHEMDTQVHSHHVMQTRNHFSIASTSIVSSVNNNYNSNNYNYNYNGNSNHNHNGIGNNNNNNNNNNGGNLLDLPSRPQIDWSNENYRPIFEPSPGDRNVTAQLGKSTFLRCRIRQITDETVSTRIIATAATKVSQTM